ncbi:MAG: SynChlorMet cassette radical SAM/SPASM protein ScmF [Deltaproteobacteria bacterium]|nr:SynChlorMet cassette radical SAM/SPASM protein ScmF [Deltaproteobacteria bacterium]
MTAIKEERKFSLNQIYFYLTEGCNLRCRHCWLAPKYEDDTHTYPSLSLNLFKSIVEQARPLGLSAVKLTGGEPLLHPQIREILEEIRTGGLRLVVETNGLLCTGELARIMASCEDPFVAVSLDAADAKIHEWVRGVSGCFEKTVDGISNLVNAGIEPQLIMTVARCNRDEIEAVVRLAESMGAGSVKFNVLQPVARGEQMHEAGETLEIEELIELGRWVENTLSASTNLPLIFDHPPAFRPLSKMFGNSGTGCDTCGILGILGVLADGSYSLCGIGKTVPELVFGHADIDRLDDVWNNSPVLRELREGLPDRLEGICGKCLLKSICRGNCIAQNYYLNKNLWAPFWYCHEANSKGLFSETRLKKEEMS